MTNLPLEALLSKMSSMPEKAYCVFEYAKTSSVNVIQRHFRSKFRKEPSHWHNIAEKSINGDIYQDMLSEWLLPQLEKAVPDFILQQNGAPPHWNKNVREFLNKRLPHRWIGRAGSHDLTCLLWPPR
ncbi:DUF4817 domain-containing protein [Trichonephila clavipes]|nr:DUF4817 domain-containing protein [Trichonephila clavipes]